MKKICLIACLLLAVVSCKKNNPKKLIQTRKFKMGFTTNNLNSEDNQDINEQKYDSIQKYGDIYLEEINSAIPWNVLVNNTNFPSYITDDVQTRISNKNGDQVVLALNLLNDNRTQLRTDFGGNLPYSNKISDQVFEDALFIYARYLVYRFEPEYLVLSMGSNELLINNPTLWTEYKALMLGLNSRLKYEFPELKISQSVSLHYWENPSVTDKAAYNAEILGFVNAFDFAAIEYYPAFNDQHKRSEFKKSFKFINDKINVPVAVIKTGHLANNLEGSSINNTESDEKEQNDFLKSMLVNAHNYNYEFVIWDVFQDYDQIWDSLPDWSKSESKVYKDMGLKDENGLGRKAFITWQETFTN